MHEAHQYERIGDGTVRCSLCAHRCTIADGKHGICGVRINRGGTLYAATFGRVVSEAVDPIEKKPLFHFLPGTLSYSLGSVGCNFRCQHCQNWEISQAGLEDLPLMAISPEEGVERALASGSASIAWTYNEPTIWHEYPLEMGALARERGLQTVYVTNGYITEEALAELAPMLGAFRVDLKAFSDDFYRKVCRARLQPVLDATVAAHEHGMHIETVTLVIPWPQRLDGGDGGADQVGDREPRPGDADALHPLPPGLPYAGPGADAVRPPRADLPPGARTRRALPLSRQRPAGAV